MAQNLRIGAAYIRVSTDDQAELSPDAQLRVILEEAKIDGFIIPPEYIFEEKKGISGRKAGNRPQFQKMIAVAKSQNPAPFERLYLWKFSRFARNQEESTFYKGILRKKCGVEIKSISEPIADGMFGRLIETIIEWFDEYYSYNLSGEVLRGMTEKALRNGYQMVPSLGYKAVGDGKPFVIDEDRYPIVEYIFQAYHNGLDMTKIARNCNDRGWKTRRNSPFERRTILRILQNKFYVGIVEWNGYSFTGTHETRPSVTDYFEEAQERIKREYHPANRREISTCKHWLSGLLRCSVCGASLSFTRSENLKKRGDTFMCWKYAKGLHKGSTSISAKKAEAALMDSLKTIIGSRTLKFEHIKKENSETNNELSILDSALSRVAQKESRIRDAYEAGVDTLEEYKENKRRLENERQDLLAEINRLKELTAASQDDAPSAEEVLKRVEDVYALLSDPNVSYEIKGTAVRSILSEIVVDRQNREIRFHYYA